MDLKFGELENIFENKDSCSQLLHWYSQLSHLDGKAGQSNKLTGQKYIHLKCGFG